MAASDGTAPERAPGGDIVTTSLFNVTLLEESLWVGSLGRAGRQKVARAFGRRRPLSAAGHAWGCLGSLGNSRFGRAPRPYRACFGHRHDGLRACAWPLLKAMLGSPRDGEEGTGFFSFTHEEDGLTLIMDDRSYAAFEESALIERVTCAPDRWRAFEIHLGSLAWEVPGLVCFLSTIMAESRISILNLSTCLLFSWCYCSDKIRCGW